MDAEEEGETIHLLHPDGTVTVQFISAQDVGESFITHDGEERQFITTDESGEYITTAVAPAQYILAINSDGQLIATGPSQEFIAGDSEEGFDSADVENSVDVDSADLEEVHEHVAEEGDTDRSESETSKHSSSLESHEEVEMAASMRLVEAEGLQHLPQKDTATQPLEESGITVSPASQIQPQTNDITETTAEKERKITENEHDTVVEKEPTVEEISTDSNRFDASHPAQEKQNCANCYCKLIFQRGRSKKFSEALYPLKESSGGGYSVNKHLEKTVTVLEALDLLFDLKVKSTSSLIRLCQDYVFCHKCVSSLSKLHHLFVEFAEASKSPSFMKSIFHQFGVLNHFENIISQVKSEPKQRDEEQCFDDAISPSGVCEAVLDPMVEFPEVSKSNVSVNPTVKLRHLEAKTEIRRRKQSLDKIRSDNFSVPPKSVKSHVDSTNVARKSSRFPRSCKRLKSYRALAKVGPYNRDFDSEGDDDDIENQDDENAQINPDDETVGSEGEGSSDKLDRGFDKNETRNRLLNLKNRIKMLREPSPPPVKRKPGRPRKIKEEIEEIQIKVEPDHMKAEYDDGDEYVDDNEYGDITLEDPYNANAENLEWRCAAKKRRRLHEDEWAAQDDELDFSENEIIKDEGGSDTEGISLGTKSSLHKPVKCKHCCATFLKQSHYADHLKVHSAKVMSCSYCHGTFNNSRNLRRHISLNHRVRRRKKPLPRRFACPQCNFTFTRLYHLKGHLVNQHQVDPNSILGDFPCPVCSRRYITDSALKAHLDRKHLVLIREMKNQCDECGRKFLKKSDLDNHITTHTNVRRFMCEVCGFGSKRPQDLTRHRKLVHTKEVKHICQTCGKGYLSLWQMKAHQLSHDERKRFPCPEPGCGKAFRCPNNLRQHINVHQGVKHVCQYCGESYSRTAYLARHIQTNHMDTKLLKDGDLGGSDSSTKLPKVRKQKKTYQLLDNDNVIEILEPEPMELDIDLPTEDGHTQQVILHGFDDRYEGVIMEYIIG